MSGISGRSVTSATLRLFVVDGSNGGGIVSGATPATFVEGTVTWYTAPAALAPSIDSVGNVDTGQWVEFDVTSLVQSDGAVGMRIRPNSTNRVEYATRERQSGQFAPQLIVEIADGVSPTCPRRYNDENANLTCGPLHRGRSHF